MKFSLLSYTIDNLALFPHWALIGQKERFQRVEVINMTKLPLGWKWATWWLFAKERNSSNIQ